MLETLAVILIVWIVAFIADIGVTARNSKTQRSYIDELEENKELLEEQNELLRGIILETGRKEEAEE